MAAIVSKPVYTCLGGQSTNSLHRLAITTENATFAPHLVP